ncbi:MAG: phosphatase PAP2 family protein, partial [Candidatus Yonathbacteria bacterium]|nr:phosphatase PAP2 family protein [Candidatus Yonathbacteria bacterium]
YVFSIFYKSITGRIPPLFIESAIDISRKFNFGFLKNGIFWGWPSSHTTVAFAMAVTLIILYPKNKILKYGALIYALYIGLGVSINIHWFSEFIAGIIFGSIVGVVVGTYFKNQTKRA